LHPEHTGQGLTAEDDLISERWSGYRGPGRDEVGFKSEVQLEFRYVRIRQQVNGRSRRVARETQRITNPNSGSGHCAKDWQEKREYRDSCCITRIHLVHISRTPDTRTTR
jgi:hypothetical protein